MSFDRADLAEQVEAFAQRHPTARADRRGLVFVGARDRLRPPVLSLRAIAGETIAAYAGRLAAAAPAPGIERHLVLLLRAGATAIGCWQGDELCYHKAIRTYVVRGSGKAQPTYLASRGKSRYGSRLRLQNWRRLLNDVGERVAWCAQQHGEPERIFTAMPVRVASDLWEADSPPPFARDDARLLRLPVHVHRPDFEELLRVRRWMARGQLELARG